MKKLFFLFLCFGLWGCASLFTTTGTNGITFGMNREQVLKKVEPRFRIISQNENTIVVEGKHDLIDQSVVKTFTFENGRLVAVQDKF